MSNKVCIAVICVAAAALLAEVCILYSDSDGGGKPFGLSTTAASVDMGGVITITPLDYTQLDSVTYSSDGGSAISVEQSGGYCTVTGLRSGTGTVTAECGGKTASCTVSVSYPSSPYLLWDDAETLCVYNTESKNLDRAYLETETGFSTGELSLSFSSEDYAAVTLSGYSYGTLSSNGYSTGNYLADFGSVTISVTGPGGAEVGKTEYRMNSNTGERAAVGFPVSSYGTYSVKAVLTPLFPGMKQCSVSGSFEYCEGDGTIDSNMGFVRMYNWRDGGSEYGFSITVPYYEYLMYRCCNSENFGAYTSGGKTYYLNSADDITEMAVGGRVCSTISEKLKLVYKGTDLKSADYAQFILTFVQTCFTYADDAVLYGGGKTADETSVDYWAFPIETVWSGCGDCEDTSVLCAVLLKNAGFDSGIFLVPGHAVAAVALDGYDEDGALAPYAALKTSYGIMKKTEDGKTYYGCETTVERSFDIGVINRSMTVDGETYDYCNTSESWCTLHLL